MAWSVTHTLLGELENGLKVVMTNVIPDDGAGTAVRISPMRQVYAYFPGVKDCGNTPRTIGCALTVGNLVTVSPSGDMTGGLIGILSIGV